MEKTTDSFSTLLFIYQTVTIILLILIIVFGIMFILKLFKLMDSQTALNKEKLQKLHDK